MIIVAAVTFTDPVCVGIFIGSAFPEKHNAGRLLMKIGMNAAAVQKAHSIILKEQEAERIAGFLLFYYLFWK